VALSIGIYNVTVPELKHGKTPFSPRRQPAKNKENVKYDQTRKGTVRIYAKNAHESSTL
jgi:hypothetical protein